MVERDFLAIVPKLKRRIVKRKSFISKNLLINLYKNSILLLYLALIIGMMVIVVKIIIFIIDNYTKKSIASNGI